MFDVVSYIIGLVKGKEEGTGSIVLEDGDYVFTDSNSDGNVVMTKGA